MLSKVVSDVETEVEEITTILEKQRCQWIALSGGAAFPQDGPR